MANQKTNSEQAWRNWNTEQRTHFLKDHDSAKKLINQHYYQLPKEVKEKIKEHISSPKYKSGGGIYKEKEGVGLFKKVMFISFDKEDGLYTVTSADKKTLYLRGEKQYVSLKIQDMGYSKQDAEDIINSAVEWDGFSEMAKGGSVLSIKKFDDVHDNKNNKTGMVYAISGNNVVIKTVSGLHKAKLEDLELVSSMAKGGGIYSSDNIYLVNVFVGDKLVETKNIRAKNQKEANQEAEDMESDFKKKHGEHLRIKVEPVSVKKEGGNIVVTKTKDIPDLEEKIKSRTVTYRGLGTGKLSDDFYEAAGGSGVALNVDGKEYYVTTEEFNKIARGPDGLLRIRFSAPAKRMEPGGNVSEQFQNGEIVWDSGNKCYGVVLNNYGNDESGEVRLDSDGNQPTKNLHKLGSEGDKGTKAKLQHAMLSHKKLVDNWGYEKINYGKGGKVDKDGLVFFKSGSHRSSEKIQRSGIPYISLWSMGWNKPAATQMLATTQKEYEKVKGIKGVSAPLKKLPEGYWGSRMENEKIHKAFMAEKPQLEKGGNVDQEEVSSILKNSFYDNYEVKKLSDSSVVVVLPSEKVYAKRHGFGMSSGVPTYYMEAFMSKIKGKYMIDETEKDWNGITNKDESGKTSLYLKSVQFKNGGNIDSEGNKAWDVKYHTKEHMKKKGSLRGSMKITVKAKDRASAVAIAKKEAGKEWAILSTCKPSKMKVDWLGEGGSVNPENKRYKVYKIGRKHGMSGRRELLGKNLSLDEARRMVNSYPDSSRSMVVFTSMEEGGNVGDVDSVSQEYYELVDVNNHSEAALLLANHFGTKEEQEAMQAIIKRSVHSISQEDQRERDKIINKYHPFVRNYNRIAFDDKNIQEEYANLNYQIQSADVAWIKNNSEKYEQMIARLRSLQEKIQNKGRVSKFADGGNLNQTHSGRYISLSYSDSKMELTLTPEGKEFIEEMKQEGRADIDIMYELFEDIRANSDLRWDNNLGESGFGLTSAPGVVEGFDDMEGEESNEGRVWYFPDYMIRSEIDDLLDSGKLVLTGANNSFEQGGNIETEIASLEEQAKKVEGEITMAEANLSSIREKINKLKAKQMVDDVQAAIHTIAEKSGLMPWQKDLTEDEIAFIVTAVNLYGTGEHPYITYKNWHGLKFAYVKEVLGKLQPEDISESGLAVKDSVMKKFNVAS